MRVDPHMLARRRPQTLFLYRRMVGWFTAWCAQMSLYPSDAESTDDLLVEFKNIASLTKSQFAACLRGVELAIPFFKRHLIWSEAVLKDWEVVSVPKHHKPLPLALALLIAVALACIGFGRLGAGVVLQTERGLRPNELLGLTPEDIFHSRSAGFGSSLGYVLNLGVKAGTKAKRPQSVLVSAIALKCLTAPTSNWL